ncbi:MAG: hypothetical protein HY826_12545 [Actinobacteria bacterium]|nr:hypothetical protein [Actinomycetota bacterium]
MFTTGSKLFLGATTISVVTAVVFSASKGGPIGLLGTIGLVTAAVVFALLAGINLFVRDGNAASMEPDIQHAAAAAQPPVGRSMWPLAAAVGVGGLVVGAVSKPVVFKVAVVVVLGAVVEWMVQGWSERASADAQYNTGLRGRIMHSLEFPILATVGGAGIVYAFSRVMLTANQDAGRWIFIVIGALVLFGGFLFANRRSVSKQTVAGLCAVSALALLGVGVASALQGQRTIHPHPTVSDSDQKALCLAGGEDEVDENASQDVSLKSSVVANVYLQDDGDLVAFVNGYANVEYHEIVVPRNAQLAVIFHNDSMESQRLTGRFGSFPDKPEAVSCTTAVHPGKTAFLGFKIPKTNAASSTPLEFVVPGVDGAIIEITVP